MDKERFIHEEIFEKANENPANETAAVFYGAIRSVLNEIIERSNLSQEEIEKMFTQGLSKNEQFVKLMEHFSETPDEDQN